MAVAELVSVAECLTYMGLANSATPNDIAMLATIKPGIERHIRVELGCGLIWAQYQEFLPITNPSDNRDRIRWYTSPYHFADGGMTLQLRELPVRQIVSVYADYSGASHGSQTEADFPETTLLDPGYDYYLDQERKGFSQTGALARNRWPWPSEAMSVMVNYIAGYTQQEFRGQVDDYRTSAEDARTGVLLTIAYNFEIAKAASSSDNDVDSVALSMGGRPQSERLGDWSQSYSYPNQSNSESLISDPTIPPRAAVLLARFKRVNSLVS